MRLCIICSKLKEFREALTLYGDCGSDSLTFVDVCYLGIAHYRAANYQEACHGRSLHCLTSETSFHLFYEINISVTSLSLFCYCNLIGTKPVTDSEQ